MCSVEQYICQMVLFVLLNIQFINCEESLQRQKLRDEPYFIEEPFDQKVKLGDRTVLPCKVAGLDIELVDGGRGHVQWTRGGFGLGIGRQIEDWPHFRMIGQNLQSKQRLFILC